MYILVKRVAVVTRVSVLEVFTLLKNTLYSGLWHSVGVGTGILEDIGDNRPNQKMVSVYEEHCVS